MIEIGERAKSRDQGAKSPSTCILSPVLYILCVILFMGLPRNAMPKMSIYPENIHATLEYDDNVTRERLRKDYQYGIIWRLSTGFGIGDIIPAKGLSTNACYKLRMRDVNTTNDEDYSSHSITLSCKTKLRKDTIISLKEAFEIWSSQNDLFNFYDSSLEIEVNQPFGKRTKAHLSYKNRRKWFQNDVPEVQARNHLYHQIGVNLSHDISDAFRALVGYVHQPSIYNRSPIDFKGGRQIALDGVQRDRQNVITLGFRAFLLNGTTTLSLSNQFVRSNSNSRAFNFSGNRTEIMLVSIPSQKLSLEFIYRIVAYDLGAYQTPDKGYELSEIRTDDQSGIKLGMIYNISDQVSLKFNYEHIENTVFFTREFYKKNILSTGLEIKF
jgi:hypothetical protein